MFSTIGKCLCGAVELADTVEEHADWEPTLTMVSSIADFAELLDCKDRRPHATLCQHSAGAWARGPGSCPRHQRKIQKAATIENSNCVSATSGKTASSKTCK